MKQLTKFKKTIEVHQGATLGTNTWRCVCGEDLGLQEQNGLNGPTKEQIVGKWAEHLAGRLLSKRAVKRRLK